MLFDFLSNQLPLIILCLAAIFYTLLYKRKYPRLRDRLSFRRWFFFSSRANSYLGLLYCFGILCLLVSDMAASTNSMPLEVVTRISWFLYVYCFFGWTSISLAALFGNTNSSKLQFFRPRFFLFLTVLTLFQIAPFFLANAKVADFNGQDTVELRLDKFWVWLAGVTLLGSTVGYLIAGLYLIIRSFNRHSAALEFNNAFGGFNNKAVFRYRFYSLLALTLIQIVVYSPDLLGHLFYSTLHWDIFSKIGEVTRQLLMFVLIGPFALLVPLDSWLLGWFRKLMRLRAAKFLKEVRWLVDLSIERFPANYQYNPYDWYEDLRDPIEVQTDVVEFLVELRDSVESHFKAGSFNETDVANDDSQNVMYYSTLFYYKYKRVHPVLIIGEAKVWACYLNNCSLWSEPEVPARLRAKISSHNWLRKKGKAWEKRELSPQTTEYYLKLSRAIKSCL